MKPRIGHFPPSAIGDDAIRTALQEGLRLRGSAATITRIERRLSDYASSFTLEELDVELDDGSRLALMLKDLSRRAMNDRAVCLKPTFILDPQREVSVYRTIVDPLELGARLFATHVDVKSDGCWLVIERIHGSALHQIGEFDAWTDVMRWLARMHHRLSSLDLAELTKSARLLTYDAAYYRLWLIRAEWLLQRTAHQFDLPMKAFAHLRTRYHRVAERLLALPLTVVHGEFYASNVLTSTIDGQLRVVPVDWETAAVAPGLMDLAALTLGKWTPEDRRVFLAAYLDALPPGGARMSLDDLAEAVEYCQIHLSVQWLGWFGSQLPHPDHARDWLAEALERAERLSL